MSEKIFRRLTLRSLLCAGALLGTLMFAAGCGGDDSDSDSGSDGADKPAKIAYLAAVVADYQTAMMNGMKEKVSPAGGGVTLFNANFDPDKQQQQCQDAIQSGRYNTIVIAPITPAGAVPCLNLAKAAGLPVINLESPIGKDVNAVEPTLEGNIKSIPTRPITGQKLEAEMVKAACADKNPCNVVGEIAFPGDPLSGDIWNYIDKTLPNVKIVRQIPTQYDPAEFVKGLRDVFTDNPNIDVVGSLADFSAIAAAPMLEEIGKRDQVVLLGNGASKPGVAAIKDGTIDMTLGTWPFQMGQLAGVAAVEAANGKEISGPAGIDAFLMDEPQVVTKDNVDQMKAEW